jgi:hypothetical protein
MDTNMDVISGLSQTRPAFFMPGLVKKTGIPVFSPSGLGIENVRRDPTNRSTLTLKTHISVKRSLR